MVGHGSESLSEVGSRVRRRRKTEFVKMVIDNNSRDVTNASQLQKTYEPNDLVSG